MPEKYVRRNKTFQIPRLPLEGNFDLTYRCNNDCLHCWLRIPANSSEAKNELTFKEIKRIADDAKKMGCRRWSISGGEPMLRPDFSEIFDYLTAGASSYSINTNGTLITPAIAKLLKRKGAKMVALYGATAGVHDRITRNPGSFEAVMRGFRYLKEAGAGFTVQLIPMRNNYHQFQDMVALAKSLSSHYRIGAPWLWLSACGDPEKNKEIAGQRLPSKEVVELDKPDLSYEDWMEGETGACHQRVDGEYLFTSCIENRRNFHIDPYGGMSFCCFIKDPGMRYDLRKGSFRDCWENFIPSLAKKVKASEEYKKDCGSCDLRKDCRFCPVYAYLEHRDYNRKVGYLCSAAAESKKFKEDWQKNRRRYFRIADITIEVDSDLPMTENTFRPKFEHFAVDGPGEDSVHIRHHFFLPDLEKKDLGKEIYRKPPWAIHHKNGSWIYLGISPGKGDKRLHRVVTFNSGHTRAEIYNDKEETFLKGNLHSLTMFPSDQILLARILADRRGCFLHSCGVNFEGRGLLFAGHSEAGKSTMARMLKGKAEILCDDRIIVRQKSDGFRIYGTWSHGDVTDVSADSAPLKAIYFLKKARENREVPLTDKKEIAKRLLAYLIRPFVTADWWEKTLELVGLLADEIPCYELYFDKSGRIVEHLENRRDSTVVT